MHDSLVASGAKSTAIIKRESIKNDWDDRAYMRDTKVSNGDVAVLRTKFPNYAFVPVMEIPWGIKMNYHDTNQVSSYGSYYQNASTAYDFTEADYQKFGFTLKGGRLPAADDEVVITDYQYDNFIDLKYINTAPGASQGIPITQIAEGSSGILHSDAHPRIISFNSLSGFVNFKIVGVINTGFDFDLYNNLKTAANDRSNMMKIQELSDVLQYGFSNSLYLNDGYFSRHAVAETSSYIPGGFEFKMSGDSSSGVNRLSKVSTLDERGIMFFEEGKTLETLAQNEIVIHINSLWPFFENTGYNINTSFGYDTFYLSTENHNDTFDNIGDFKEAATTAFRARKDFMNALSLVEMNARNWTVKESTPLVLAGVYYDLLTKDADFLSNFESSWYSEPDTFSYTVYLSDSFTGAPALMKAMEPPPPYKMIQATLTGNDMALIKFLTKYKEGEFIAKNQFSAFFETFSNAVESIADVFVYVGLGFAVFAALMMMSFITMTINHKKREIGILRAIGARKLDVFKIFFNESLIMAVVNFVFAVILTIVAIILLNNLIGGGLGMSIVLLSFGIRQAALIAGVSLLVAVLASALPVRKISKLKPIDAIQNRK